jgi:nucleoside-diphosphate-sugar epimerase
MKVLVTGASGFIGRALCSKLVARGDTVIGAGRTRHAGLDPKVEFIQTDIKDPKELMNLQVDTIFHLAANPYAWYAQQHPVEDFLTNAGGTVHMLELAKKCNAHLVLPSSISLYAGDKEKFREEDLQITSFYAAGKRTAELYCKQYHDSFGVKTAVVRFGYVYGKGVGRGPIADILKGGPLFVHSDTVLDFVHISDAVDALLKVAGKEKFGIYNISSGKGVSVRELLVLMKSNLKPDNQKPKFRLVLDTTLAKQELGWEPKVSLEEGLCDL